uniref:Cys_knot domain-containing protein n=1 Tax=Panagrellus redivivus TaxID=6233 RepID=A0A7E4USC3_PANRE
MEIAAALWVFTFLAFVAGAPSERNSCNVITNHTAITVNKTDMEGRKCSGSIPISVCMGLCKTSEKGTYIFPNHENDNTACVPTAVALVTAPLTDCHPEADVSIRTISYNQTTACGCNPFDHATLTGNV